MALVTAALVALVLPLIQGRAEGWPAWTWASFAASGVLFAAFTGYQRRLAASGGAPLIDPAIFQERAFAAGVVAQFVAFLGQASFFLVLAVYLQGGVGLSALRSGLLFCAIGAGYLATSAAAGGLVARFGRQTVAIGATGMVALWPDVGSSGLSEWHDTIRTGFRSIMRTRRWIHVRSAAGVHSG